MKCWLAAGQETARMNGQRVWTVAGRGYRDVQVLSIATAVTAVATVLIDRLIDWWMGGLNDWLIDWLSKVLHLTTKKSSGERDIQVTTPGARRRRRPRTAWMDNIKTSTGLSVEESIRLTEDRDTEKVRPRCGQPSDRGRLKNRSRHKTDHFIDVIPSQCALMLNETAFSRTRPRTRRNLWAQDQEQN